MPAVTDPQDRGDGANDNTPRVETEREKITLGAPVEIVKIAVTVDGKSQLLALNQSEPLEATIQRLCVEHGLKWKEGWFALQFTRSMGVFTLRTGVLSPGLKYVTEDNRDEIKNGSELKLTYAPAVYSDVIIDRLSSSKRSWGFAKMAALAPDITFLRAFSQKPRAVDQVLAHLRSEGRDDRLSTRELQSVLKVVFWLLRHRLVSVIDLAVLHRVAALVRADYTVESEVLDTSLKILVELSLPPWDMAVVQEVSMMDLVPLLWDQDRPPIQTAALELMTTMAVREARDGPTSPEATGKVTKILTSLQVRDTIARYVLPNPVDSNMAVQLLSLQRLLLRPLREALLAEPESYTLPGNPPQLPARRRTKGSMRAPRSRSSSLGRTELRAHRLGSAEAPNDENQSPISTSPGSEQRSLDGLVHYKVLGNVAPVAVSRPAPAFTSNHPLSPLGDTDWKRSSGDSTSSFSRVSSFASLDSSDAISWQALLDGDEDPDCGSAVFGLSRLGAECLQYLRAKHPTVTSSAAVEEEAMHGSLSNTAERLVRVLAEELGLTEDPVSLAHLSPSAPAPPSLSASTLTLNAMAATSANPLPLSASTLSLTLPASTLSPQTAPTDPPSLRCGSGRALYQPLIFSTPDEEPFFHELFCLGVNLLAKTRREMRARTWRDQDKVFRVVQRQFREALAAQVRSWGQLEDWLSELPYSAVSALWERERAAAERRTVLGSAAALEMRATRSDGTLQLVRQQRLDTLRAGACFFKLHSTKGKRGSGESGYIFLSLGKGDSTLQYADCSESGEVLATPKILPLTSVIAVVPGKKIPHQQVQKSKKLGALPAFSLLLDPNEWGAKSLDFVAPDVRTMEQWVDGFNILLGKEKQSASVKHDMELLLDMEMRLQLMELDGVPIPQEPPPVPEPPPNFDFVT